MKLFQSKMYKKILLIAGLCFCFSGCYAEYNLNIGILSTKESIKINETSYQKYSDTSVNSYRYYVDKALNTHTSIKYYEDQNYFETELSEGFNEYTKVLNTNNGYGIDLKASYTIESYFGGTVINNCYESFNHEVNDSVINIETSNKFLCLNKFIKADYIKISIKTIYNLLVNNADEVLDDGTMVWIINKNNYTKKPIIIKSSTDYKSVVDEESSIAELQSSIDEVDNQSSSKINQAIVNKIKKGNNILLLIGIGILFIIGIIVLVIRKEYKKK